MLTWKTKKIEKELSKPAPLQKIYGEYKDDVSYFLFWGDNPINIIQGLKFSNENTNIPKLYKIILIDIPYFEDPNTTIISKSNFKTTNTFQNLYNSSNPFSKDYFKGSLEIYFTNLKELFNQSWDLLNEQGFFIIKYTGRYRHYLKVLLDNILGYKKFINEVFIQSPFYQKNLNDPSNNLTQESFSSIFIYSKSENQRIYPDYKDKSSGGYWHTMHSKGQGPERIFKLNGKEIKISPPIGRHWTFKQETIDEMCLEGKIKLNTKEKPVYWIEPKQGHIVDNNWLDINAFKQNIFGWGLSKKVYSRILKSFSKENDVVLHIFYGNESMLEVSQELNRKYVGIDPRILALSICKNFLLNKNLLFNAYSVGIYQGSILEGNKNDGYRKFILNLLNAKELSNSLMFLGIYENSLVHISNFYHTYTFHELESCISELDDFKNLFNSMTIISREFLEDDKWNQIVEDLTNKKLIQFWNLSSIWKKLGIKGIFLEDPVVEIDIKIDKNLLNISLIDFYFLNDEIIDIRKLNINEKESISYALSHWSLELYDFENNLIFSEIYYRSKEGIKLNLELDLQEKEINLIIIEVFDLCGARYKYEKKFEE